MAVNTNTMISKSILRTTHKTTRAVQRHQRTLRQQKSKKRKKSQKARITARQSETLHFQRKLRSTMRDSRKSTETMTSSS